MNNVRNFCIIAHIDHGKSTLADRILELGGILQSNNAGQVLDSMDLERERGITIKAAPVRIPYRSRNGQEYILNLIDTPGHVDFNYEVSRSLKACEGAILVVDASQGVEAQTIANAHLAIEAGLKIVPVINKIDLPSARIDDCYLQIEEVLGLPMEEVLLISAKHGTGVQEMIEAIIERVPAPKGSSEEPLRCHVFDSYYDPYLGVILHVRVFSGKVAPRDQIMLKFTGKVYEVEEVGYFTLSLSRSPQLVAGDVGYLAAIIRDTSDIKVGDTVVSPLFPDTPAIPGFRDSKPMVFCGLYPLSTNDYGKLGIALQKFKLNDSSIIYEKESSAALGHGFRVGFLGMLHMEITIERLRREYGLDLIATLPSVLYKVVTTGGDELMIDNPSLFPAPPSIEHIEEPVVKARIIVPNQYVGPLMELAKPKRGTMISVEHLGDNRALYVYEFPLAEIITDFHDRLKSVTQGYGSMDYDLATYRPGNLVKVDILVNEEIVDALSFISTPDTAMSKGRAVVQKLRKLIPRQQFKVPLQATIGGKIIAREDIAPIKKDVLAKCYGGDITRKRKLLEKQREGKKKLKMVGSVEVPQEAFLSLLKLEDE